MNEPRDSIEEELSALIPREVSPELYRRVAEGLASRPPGIVRRRGFPALVGGLAAAACLAAVFFRWGGGGAVEKRPIDDPPAPAPAVAVDDSKPMLLAYQRALARSPEELGALLDRHALADPGPKPGLVQIRDFTRSDAALDTLLGED